MKTVIIDYMQEGRIGHKIFSPDKKWGRTVEICMPSDESLIGLLDQLKEVGIKVVDRSIRGLFSSRLEGENIIVMVASGKNSSFRENLSSLQRNPGNTIFLIGSESMRTSFCAENIILVGKNGEVIKDFPRGVSF